MILALVRMVLIVAVTLREAAGLTWRRLRGSSQRAEALRQAQRWGFRISTILGLKINVSGDLPNAPVIFVANHRSYTDILALLALKASFFLAKSEITEWPLIGSSAKNANTIFVNRDDRESRRRAKAEIGDLVQSGETVTVFCEGTTSQGPGLLPFRPGVFYLAAERNLTVVPVAIQYASEEDAWIDDDSLARHFFDRFRRATTHVRISIGPPLRQADGGLLKQHTESWIADELQRHPTLERRPVCPREISTATSFSAALPAS